jgi:hypothetical protein
MSGWICRYQQVPRRGLWQESAAGRAVQHTAEYVPNIVAARLAFGCTLSPGWPSANWAGLDGDAEALADGEGIIMRKRFLDRQLRRALLGGMVAMFAASVV